MHFSPLWHNVFSPEIDRSLSTHALIVAEWRSLDQSRGKIGSSIAGSESNRNARYARHATVHARFIARKFEDSEVSRTSDYSLPSREARPHLRSLKLRECRETLKFILLLSGRGWRTVFLSTRFIFENTFPKLTRVSSHWCNDPSETSVQKERKRPGAVNAATLGIPPSSGEPASWTPATLLCPSSLYITVAIRYKAFMSFRPGSPDPLSNPLAHFPCPSDSFSFFHFFFYFALFVN